MNEVKYLRPVLYVCHELYKCSKKVFCICKMLCLFGNKLDISTFSCIYMKQVLHIKKKSYIYIYIKEVLYILRRSLTYIKEVFLSVLARHMARHTVRMFFLAFVICINIRCFLRVQLDPLFHILCVQKKNDCVPGRNDVLWIHHCWH